jgi:hypothetical protein
MIYIFNKSKRNKMTIENELMNEFSFIPNEIFQNILYGYLNKNLLELLMSKQIKVLQNAVILENSTRRIKKFELFMKLSKSELITFILLKTNGLKNIRWYIRSVEINSLKIQKMLSFNTNNGCKHVFNLNNGFTHKYYRVIESNPLYFHCLEIENYKISNDDEIIISECREMTRTVCLNITELEKAVYISGAFQNSIDV